MAFILMLTILFVIILLGEAEAASGTPQRQALDAKRSVAVCRTRRVGSENPGLLARIKLSFVCSCVLSFRSSVRLLVQSFVCSFCSLVIFFIRSFDRLVICLFVSFVRSSGSSRLSCVCKIGMID